jgi:hypothetical protein
VRLADLSPFAVDAIARTHGLVEDLDFECPTWDGRVLHIARVETETNVLHEVAHWIAAERVERRMPNYGLGKDPDGGRTPMGGRRRTSRTASRRTATARGRRSSRRS